tara:strand:- start:150 stop:704 length:555 start_codon:yes stop_codon:yes gene_type:complete
MTSSDKFEIAVDYAFVRIEEFVATPLSAHRFGEAVHNMNELMQLLPEHPSFLETLIRDSTKDKFAFIILKLLSAHYESNGIEKPRILSVWLTDYLYGNLTEPKWGSTGPKKLNYKKFFIKLLAHQIEAAFDYPLRFLKEDPKHISTMHVVAAASHRYFKKTGDRVMPTSPEGVNKSYRQATMNY